MRRLLFLIPLLILIAGCDDDDTVTSEQAYQVTVEIVDWEKYYNTNQLLAVEILAFEAYNVTLDSIVCYADGERIGVNSNTQSGHDIYVIQCNQGVILPAIAIARAYIHDYSEASTPIVLE